MDIKTRIDVNDILVIFALILIAIGCWLIYPPAAFIFVGLIILAIGLYGALRKA